MTTLKNSVAVNVNNSVINYAQAHMGARSIKVKCGSMNQARKALGGIGNEPIVIGKNDKKEKIYTTVGAFMGVVGIPYSNGQVQLASIKAAWDAYLKDDKDNLLLCRNVNQRVKIGKQNYLLYRQDAEGKYKPASIYMPAPVGDNSWDPYRICEGLAQSKFIDEVKATCEASKAEFDELKANGALFVHDALIDKYVPVDVK